MIPNSDTPNWIIAPVTRAVSYVGEEMFISGTLIRSLASLNGQEVLLKVAREKLVQSNETQAIQAIDRLLVEAPGLGKSAAELLQNDYAVINSHSLISMWAAVEVAVEDTVVLVLTKEPSALDLFTNAGVKTSSFAPAPLSYEDARRFYPRIEGKLREKLKVGEYYIKLLDLLEIKLSCSSHVLSKMDEINQVRNCLMHRGGFIDARATESVEALQPFLNKQILITQSRYHEYYDAISGFLVALLNGVIASKYISTIASE